MGHEQLDSGGNQREVGSRKKRKKEARPPEGKPGYVYIIHFEEPLAHAKHYTGSTEHPRKRFRDHATGHGARITEVLMELGIEWRVGALFQVKNCRKSERDLKKQTRAAKYCEICNPNGWVPRGAVAIEVAALNFPTRSAEIRRNDSVQVHE